MLTAIIFTGVLALIITIVGSIPLVSAVKNVDAEKQIKATKILFVASIVWFIFLILIFIRIVKTILPLI